jgi:small subunit ribosomal protein S17
MAKGEQKECNDKKCPIHGNVIPRGRTFTGLVVSVSPHKSAVVEWGLWRYVPKYERYEKKKTRISVHNPGCIGAQKGDRVLIQECRPLSKTKNFTITKILGKEELFLEKERLMEEAKVKSRKEAKEEREEKEKKEAKEEKE